MRPEDVITRKLLDPYVVKAALAHLGDVEYEAVSGGVEVDVAAVEQEACEADAELKDLAARLKGGDDVSCDGSGACGGAGVPPRRGAKGAEAGFRRAASRR